MSKDYDIWEHGFSSLVKEQMEGGFGSPLDYQEGEGEMTPQIAGIADAAKSMLPQVAEDPTHQYARDPNDPADAPSPFAVDQQISRDLTQFKPLDIDNVDEFGKRYAQQIHKLADQNDIGDYIGYTMSAKEKLIQLVGTKAVLTINFHLDPVRISALNR